MSIEPGIDPKVQSDFNAAYWAAQPPDIVAFRKLPYNQFSGDYVAGSLTRSDPTVLLPLAAKYPIDIQIVVWGEDPYQTMVDRKMQGYTWKPSFGQSDIPVGPGIPGSQFIPPLPTYDPHNPPPGSIKVSTDIADYPPFGGPVVVIPKPGIADPVGTFQFAQIDASGAKVMLYGSNWGDPYPVGYKFTNARGSFIKVAWGNGEMIQDPATAGSIAANAPKFWQKL